MEAFETLWFASRLLKEWRAGFHLSELNTTIFFLEECLGAQRPRDDQRIGIIVHLLKARLTRCVYTCHCVQGPPRLTIWQGPYA
jgi:hypothetical protein